MKGEEEGHEAGRKEGSIGQRNGKVPSCKKDEAGSQCKEENFCLYEKHSTEPRNHTKKIRTVYARKGKIKTRKDFMK